jgi:hypothetical protein
MQPFLSFLTTAWSGIAGTPVYVPVLLLIACMVLFVRIPLLADVLILPYRLVLWIVRSLGLSRKTRTWSVVYDSHTKLPLDPVYVTVRNTLGVEVASMITDINGRFSLLLPRGIYTIDAQKTNYAFPSYELRNAPKDGQYVNLYYGKKIEVIDTEQPVTVSIPMDPIGNDWNEEEKKRLQIFSHFGKQGHIADAQYLYLLVGTLLGISHFTYFKDPFSMNLVFFYFGLILLNLVIYLIQPTQYAHSVVLDKHTGLPLAFAKVTIYSTATKNMVVSKVTSFEGQFAALLPKGNYYLTISTRDDTGTYSLRHTSLPFRLGTGYLGRKFSV